MYDVERRDKLQIYSDIIEACKVPTKLTKIIRLANLQYNTFLTMMPKLLEKKMVKTEKIVRTGRKKIDKRTKYTFEATEKGREFKRKINAIYEEII